MKDTFQTIALFLFSATLAFISCKKDKLTPTEILTTGTCWQTVLVEGYDSTNQFWVAVPIEDCDADNCFTFHADQSLSIAEGTLKCDPSDPQTAEGSWSLSDDGKKLSLSDNSTTDIGTVVEISSGKLVCEFAIDEEKLRITMRTRE